jgi:hypothetical protein
VKAPDYEIELAHLLEFAKLEHFKLHIWHRVKQMDETAGYQGIKDEFLNRVKNAQSGES